MIDLMLDRRLIPDAVVRAGIRRIVAGRLKEQEAGGPLAQARRFARLLEDLRRAPVALAPQVANAQHYEVPPAFFEQVLGPRLKYSCAWWPDGVTTLAEAEERMLDATVAHAGIEDGQQILELGCGWGSLTLYLARRFPNSRITALSNSSTQRPFVLERARACGFEHVSVITDDVNRFDTRRRFDRIVSVEMLEHVRNYDRLFGRIAGWLAPGGRFFAHVFTHRRYAYTFEPAGPADWMARHFFTGGTMPSEELFPSVQQHLEIEARWRYDGRHYQRTAEAWLRNLDRHRDAVEPILAAAYGPRDVGRWLARWRTFFMACAEMFGYEGGSEWGVSHLRFASRP
jgi:cyclopropane-fatty-acyl-phospholipid synthase